MPRTSGTSSAPCTSVRAAASRATRFPSDRATLRMKPCLVCPTVTVTLEESATGSRRSRAVRGARASAGACVPTASESRSHTRLSAPTVPDFADREGRIQILGHTFDAIHDRWQRNSRYGSFRLSSRSLAPGHANPMKRLRLQQADVHKLVRVPPERRARGRAQAHRMHSYSVQILRARPATADVPSRRRCVVDQ